MGNCVRNNPIQASVKRHKREATSDLREVLLMDPIVMTVAADGACWLPHCHHPRCPAWWGNGELRDNLIQQSSTCIIIYDCCLNVYLWNYFSVKCQLYIHQGYVKVNGRLSEKVIQGGRWADEAEISLNMCVYLSDFLEVWVRC